MLLIIHEIDDEYNGVPKIYSDFKLEKSNNYIIINGSLFDYTCNILNCSYMDVIFCVSNNKNIIDLVKNQFNNKIIELVVNFIDKTIKFNNYNSNLDLSELEYKSNKFLNSKHINLSATSDNIHNIYNYIKMELLLVVDTINVKSANSSK